MKQSQMGRMGLEAVVGVVRLLEMRILGVSYFMPEFQCFLMCGKFGQWYLETGSGVLFVQKQYRRIEYEDGL